MPRYPISGGPISKRVPEGDNRERLVCNICDYIEYDNPKIVTGVVAAKNNRILLCKRDIEPQKGLWTLPAGFLELGESPEQGALREASEEANASISIDSLLAIYTITRLSMIQLIYRGELMDENVSAGEETQDVGLFSFDNIPWNKLAFPSVSWALNHYHKIKKEKYYAPFRNPDGQSGDFNNK